MPIRPARPGDAPAVARVARAAWHAAYDDIIGPAAVDSQVEEWYAEADLRRSISGDGPFYVAVENDAVVGFAQGVVTDEGEAWLPRIYVAPEHWGSGHGSALLERVAGDLADRDPERLQLVVLADNDVGRFFYEGHGFSVEERRTGEIGGVECEELVFSAPLDALAGEDG